MSRIIENDIKKSEQKVVEMEGIKPSSVQSKKSIIHTVCFIRYIFGLSFAKSHLKQRAD